MNPKELIPIALLLCSTHAQAQDDMIIYRDGRIRKAKIIQVNTDRTLFNTGRKTPEEWVDNSDVYMLKFKERGNVAFNEKGERILTGPGAKDLTRMGIMMYLISGKELVAFDLEMDRTTIRYKQKNKKNAPIASIDKSEVFMLRYPDGSRDILNDIMPKQTAEELKPAVPQNTAETEAAGEESEDKTPALRPAVITTKKGTKTTVYVKQETKTKIIYKRIDDNKAPVFTVAKANIRSIKYK